MGPEDLVKQGFSVIPVKYRTKTPTLKWRNYQNRLPTDTELGWWFRPGRLINAAVICCSPGLTVLDFDTRAAYEVWSRWASGEGGWAREVAMNTYRVYTSRGVHVYVWIDGPTRCAKIFGDDGSVWGDIKSEGGYVLIPPSVHPDGTKYRAVDPGAEIIHVSCLADVLPNPPLPREPDVPLPLLTHVYPSSSLWPTPAIDEIKARISLLEYFPAARPSGGQRWFLVRCPWHDDRSPSLRLDMERGIAYCWSGCLGDKGGDVVTIHAKFQNLTNKEAFKELARKVSV